MLKSISSKLVTLFISVTALAFIVTSVVFLFAFSRTAYAKKEKALVSGAESMAEFVALDENRVFSSAFNSFVKESVDAIPWVINGSREHPDFANADPEMWPQKWNDLTDEGQKLIGRALVYGEESVTEIFSNALNERTISVIVPILKADKSVAPEYIRSLFFMDGSYYDESSDSYYVFREDSDLPYLINGAVVLNGSLSDTNDLYSDAIGILLIALVVSLLIALIVAVVFSLKITTPINEMKDTAYKIVKGDYDTRVNLPDTTELAGLGTSINELTSKVKRSITKYQNETVKLNNIINNISDGLAAYDENLRLIKYNSALLEICKEDYMDYPDVKETILATLEDGEARTVVHEGEDILRFAVTRIATDNMSNGVLVIVSDISKSERLEKLRNEFVANVSHEFRTPLTIIQGSMEMLQDGIISDPEEIQNCYGRIYNETSALKRLVRDLLDISRFKAGTNKINQAKMNLEELLAGMVANFEPIAAEKKIHLIYEHTDIPQIYADYDRVRQLIIIFIDNAIKFTPENGYIIVSNRVEENLVFTDIKDSGIGIDEKEIPYLFDRFYKADKARGGSETGTGLGLNIAKQIVDLHGGRIDVESKLGKGTTFKVGLPVEWKAPQESDENEEGEI